ncbi:MAG: hypothetical protein EAY81_03745 [Bacteroidetes bacterium]|nr:MAG: hypothetical protein EAY81_03745 [Bacteroidota bacterium]
MMLMLSTFFVCAQNGQLTVLFDKSEKQIISGELLTNVVKVVNTGNQQQSIKITIDYPFGWKQVGASSPSFIVQPGDTIFVPVRFITGGLLGGNNKYMVNANVLTVDDKYLTGATFWAFTKKQASWVVNSQMGNKIYFKNGENTVNFNVNVLNTGSETQPITLTLNNLSLFSSVIDSNGNNKVTKPIQLVLKNNQDTTLKFIYRHESAKRNNNRIDIENYKPYTNNEERTFSLFVNTEEPILGQEGAFTANNRIVFRKLSDRVKSNPNAFSQLPIVVEYNISNLLDNVSFSTLNIRGNAQVSENAQVMYNLQSSSSSDRYNEVLRNTNYYFGYFHTNASVQLGFVNGGFMGMQSFGRGIKASYNFGKRSSIGGFLVSNEDRKGERFLVAKGVSYQLRYYKQNKIAVEYGESNNTATGVFSRVANARGGINFLKTQTISGSYSLTWNSFTASPTTTLGGLYLINYGGTFFSNKFATNHTLGNNDANYSNSNISRSFYNHRTRITLSEKWNLTVVNNYNKTVSRLFFNANINSLNNQLTLTKAFKFTSMQFSGIYNLFEFTQSTNKMKGISITHNTFKPKEYTRFSATIEAGVNEPKIQGAKAESIPYFLFNSILFYKTLTVNTRYVLGTYGTTPVFNTPQEGITQQLLTSSVQHQYLFARTQFMLQSGLNYFYNNIFKQHTINLLPELYYFTPSGWRFRAGINYNLISGLALRNAYNNQFVTDEIPRVTNQGVFVTFGVRKEFNAPIPFKKTKFIESEFLAFFDVNGNGVKDKNERPIENVVIRVNEDEVITNDEGTALIVDANAGMAKVLAMPLDEVEGWFPNLSDSVLLLGKKINYIPFVKGVKIKGRVTIQRENIGADAGEPFDLSRIKITASGTKTYNSLTGYDGSFEFYLPFGQYTISFDETVLGEKFKLTKNNYQINVTKEADGLVISYHIIEKTRKINKKVFTQPSNPTPNAK